MFLYPVYSPSFRSARDQINLEFCFNCPKLRSLQQCDWNKYNTKSGQFQQFSPKIKQREANKVVLVNRILIHHQAIAILSFFESRFDACKLFDPKLLVLFSSCVSLPRLGGRVISYSLESVGTD